MPVTPKEIPDTFNLPNITPKAITKDSINTEWATPPPHKPGAPKRRFLNNSIIRPDSRLLANNRESATYILKKEIRRQRYEIGMENATDAMKARSSRWSYSLPPRDRTRALRLSSTHPPQQTARHKNKKTTPQRESSLLSSGERTRTSDLWVMSPTSCQLLHSAV